MRVQIVSFRCTLKNRLGQLISSSTNQDVITTPEVPDSASSLPGFVEGLKGLKLGDKKKIMVPAEKAYGFYRPDLAMEVPRSELSRGKHLKTGDVVEGHTLQDGVNRAFRVTRTDPLFVTIDANHPLAGQDLEFDVEITALHEEPAQDNLKLEYSKTLVQ